MEDEVHVIEKVSLHIELRSNDTIRVYAEGLGNINEASSSHCVYLCHHGAKAIEEEIERLKKAYEQDVGVPAGRMVS